MPDRITVEEYPSLYFPFSIWTKRRQKIIRNMIVRQQVIQPNKYNKTIINQSHKTPNLRGKPFDVKSKKWRDQKLHYNNQELQYCSPKLSTKQLSNNEQQQNKIAPNLEN